MDMGMDMKVTNITPELGDAGVENEAIERQENFGTMRTFYN
jgi:hypothetical protein